MAYGAGMLLISAAVGYFVLERAEKRKGVLKRVGQLLGWLIIIVSLVGVACRTWCVSTGAKGWRSCPFMPKASMSPLPESAPSKTSP